MTASKTASPCEGTGSAAKASPKAVRSLAALAMFLAVTAASLGGDLWSKQAAFDWLLNDPQLRSAATARLNAAGGEISANYLLASYHKRLCPGVNITLSTNPGVAFGLPMPRLLVAGAAVVTAGLVFYFFATSLAAARFLHLALALLLGGALGNLYDRLFSSIAVGGLEPIRYQVRDFIDCSQLYYPWVFNVADAWLVVGVAMLVIHWWRAGRTAGRTA